LSVIKQSLITDLNPLVVFLLGLGFSLVLVERNHVAFFVCVEHSLLECPVIVGYEYSDFDSAFISEFRKLVYENIDVFLNFFMITRILFANA